MIRFAGVSATLSPNSKEPLSVTIFRLLRAESYRTSQVPRSVGVGLDVG
jgi:hypothetical protein